MIEIKDLYKSYIKDDKEIQILKNINQKFECGKIYAIVGHSGSGKSTLLQILGMLLDFSSGTYLLNDIDVKNINDKEKALIRNKKIGFVFQSYLLNNNMKAYENVMVPMYINNDIKKVDRKNRAIQLLDKLLLSDRINHFPNELSGGEQQRIAIARALANDPKIILADEPTGNLDKENEQIILDIFKKLKEENKCIIIASHNDIVKKYADVVLSLDNGTLEVCYENK